MNLAAIVNAGMNAIPSGIRAEVTVTRQTPGTYTYGTDTLAASTPSSFTVTNAVVMPVGEQRSDIRRFDGNALVAREHRFVYLAAAACDFEPDLQDEITINARAVKVVSIETQRPDGVTPVFHILTVQM